MNAHLVLATAALLASALATTAAGAATAPTVAIGPTATIHLTLNAALIADTGNGFTGSVQGAPAFAPPFSFSLAEGDTLDYTVQFLPGQSLTLVNPSLLWSLIFADVSSDVTGTGRLQLLNSAGQALYTSATKTDTEGEAHYGQYFGADEFAGLPSTITFSGLRYVGTVVDYLEPGVTTRNYYDANFSFGADSFALSVPEPGTSALLLAGLGGVLWLAQRRGAAAV